MSIDMHLPESQAQARTTHSMVQGQIQAFESLQTAISNFAASTELDSRTYQSAKDYFSTVFAALARGGQQLAQAVARAVAKFPEDYQAQVHTQTLKQSELEIQIAAFDTLISDLEDINDQDSSGEKALHFRGMLGAYSGMRKILQEKLDALLAFNNSSEAIFADISHLANALQTGIDQTTTAWNPQKGVFITTDRQEWMEEIDEIVLRIFTTNMASEYGLSEEAAADLFPFYDQYGFDEKTVYHLHLVRQGIDEQFSEKSQEDRDYLFLRVLGGAIYGQEDWVDEFKWDQTAGDLNAAPNTTPYAIGSTRGTYFGTPMPRNKEPFETNDVREIYQELGLSEEQANELYYEIRLQNNMAPGEFKDSAEIKRKNIGQYRQYKSTAESAYGSMTDTEFDAFWDARRDRYAGQADFAHQSITTVTEMRDFQLPLIKELAGWRGGMPPIRLMLSPVWGMMTIWLIWMRLILTGAWRAAGGPSRKCSGSITLRLRRGRLIGLLSLSLMWTMSM